MGSHLQQFSLFKHGSKIGCKCSFDVDIIHCSSWIFDELKSDCIVNKFTFKSFSKFLHDWPRTVRIYKQQTSAGVSLKQGKLFSLAVLIAFYLKARLMTTSVIILMIMMKRCCRPVLTMTMLNLLQAWHWLCRSFCGCVFPSFWVSSSFSSLPTSLPPLECVAEFKSWRLWHSGRRRK